MSVNLLLLYAAGYPNNVSLDNYVYATYNVEQHAECASVYAVFNISLSY